MPTTKRGGARASSLSEPLAAYLAKRDFAKTSEPRGIRAKPSKRLRFVVQMHRASHLHYDVRLEAGGVLASWAVPKGPTLVAGERRLAMHVEDHPLAYRDFEGTIPGGQYGGGSVIVWDRGTYTLAEGTNPSHEIDGGKIKVALAGKKLHGLFTFVRIKPREGESGEPWLLIKDDDDAAVPGYDPAAHPQSVKSGKTLADIAADPKAKSWHSQRAADPLPHIASPMLATLVDAPFDGDDWLFEIKWDGYRAICTIDNRGTLALVSRTGGNLLKTFPDLRALREAFVSTPIVVDGEIVSLDAKGRSDFSRLQQHGVAPSQLTFAAFDLLYANGRDMRKAPLEERKTLLESLIRKDGIAMYSKHVLGKGVALYERAVRSHLEGIIAKKRSSPYREGRTRDWCKIKALSEQEFVIGGWTEPRASRKDFGALLLGVYSGQNLTYVGHVGTGFTARSLAEIGTQLRAIERKTSPFVDAIRANTPAHFVKPKLVAQVRFSEWTHDGHLRQPAFLGLRLDKKAGDVTREVAKRTAGV
ncbi:MAG: non-homologous end-joining DNA ligase [Vulcanimicrobiaceae bacterium]